MLNIYIIKSDPQQKMFLRLILKLQDYDKNYCKIKKVCILHFGFAKSMDLDGGRDIFIISIYFLLCDNSVVCEWAVYTYCT